MYLLAGDNWCIETRGGVKMKTNTDPRLFIFAQRIKMLREDRGWTQQELADRLDTSKSLIHYYEKAEREPGISMLAKMMAVFNEDAEYIMGVSDIRRIKKIAN